MFSTNSAGFFTNIKKKRVKNNRPRRNNVRTSKTVKTITNISNIPKIKPTHVGKIGIVIIASRSELYDNMVKLWLQILNISPKNIVPFFCYGSNTEPYQGIPKKYIFKSSVIESLRPGIIIKTMECFEHLLEKYTDITHIVRTNLSCVWSFHTLLRVLSEDGGILGPVDTNNNTPLEWPQGSCIILNKKDIKYLIENRKKMKLNDADDVIIGEMLNTKNNPYRGRVSSHYNNNRNDKWISNNIDNLININNDLCHLRCRTFSRNRKNDLEVMKKSVDKILNKINRLGSESNF
jgi:hypothetical protein